MHNPQTGDFVRYRRVQVRPENVGTGEPAYDWVDDYGIVIGRRGFRPARPDKDYLVRVYFPTYSTSPIRTLRASKITEVL